MWSLGGKKASKKINPSWSVRLLFDQERLIYLDIKNIGQFSINVKTECRKNLHSINKQIVSACPSFYKLKDDSLTDWGRIV